MFTTVKPIWSPDQVAAMAANPLAQALDNLRHGQGHIETEIALAQRYLTGQITGLSPDPASVPWSKAGFIDEADARRIHAEAKAARGIHPVPEV